MIIYIMVTVVLEYLYVYWWFTEPLPEFYTLLHDPMLYVIYFAYCVYESMITSNACEKASATPCSI